MRNAAEIASAFDSKGVLDAKKAFFLVGIGGAGMSALARMLAHRGFRVRGTDSTRSPETDRLTAEGIHVHIGHTGADLSSDEVLVVTDAIDLGSSPEVQRAKELGVPRVRRSQALGWLLKGRKVIAVTGTHGKTTTTGMIGAGLKAAGLDPLIVVGASVPDFGGPVVEGNGDWAVVEACEAYDSLHDIDPNIVVLTNLELDHTDFHGDFRNLKDSVKRFVLKLPGDGKFIFCGADQGALELRTELDDVAHGFESLQYGSPRPVDKERSDNPKSAGVRELGMSTMRRFERLSLPGQHNLNNAEGAIAACEAAGADVTLAMQGIAGFGGAERRLQVLKTGALTVIDDYAHHPSEIKASIQAVRERYLAPAGGTSKSRLIVVFQPHLYSRTAGLIPEFAEALSLADLVVITDIYPAREAPIPGVSSARIAELLSVPHLYVPNRHLLPRQVVKLSRDGDVVVGMGAGNIGEFAPDLIREIEKRPGPNVAMHNLRVVVAFGGDSAEREVSLHSGREIAAALKRKGHHAELVDFSELLLRTGDLSRFCGNARPDAVILGVHGTHAEDGAIQGLLELLHIPYSGSRIQASALAFNKDLTKSILKAKGLRVPKGVLLTAPEDDCPVRAPAVVKPNSQGSTVGLSFVEDQADLDGAIRKAFSYDTAVLVEEWVRGMEISVPVLGAAPLPAVEIAPKGGKYDFGAKYVPGATEEIVPARLPERVLEKTGELALAAHRALGCEGASRTDMIVERPYGGSDPVILEVNTLPGMTSTSLLPNSARSAGMSFDDLVQWILEDTLKRHGVGSKA